MSLPNVLVGIDIGTSGIKITVADSTDNFVIKAMAEYPSQGVQKGRIIDIDRAVKSLENAIRLAEEAGRTEIRDIIVNVSGPEVQGILSTGSLLISRSSHRVTEWDVVRVLELARQNIVPTGKETICAVPRSFFVDGNYTPNPVGLRGRLLEVETMLILAPPDLLQERLDLAKRLGLKVDSVNAGIVATAGSALSPEDTGVALVDVGAGLTEIGIFDERGLCWLTSLPIGGDYITSDISFGLQVPKELAEKIKLQFGSLNRDDFHEGFTIPGLKGDGPKKINRQFVTEIIDSRITEIFDLIKQAILQSGYNDRVRKGLIFTGGVTKVPGFLERAHEYLKVPVCLGHNDGIYLGDPRYSCSLGLVLCHSQNVAGLQQTASVKDESMGFLARIIRIFKKFV
ncbi:cell division protein FtsA [Thermincola ferriacetica]